MVSWFRSYLSQRQFKVNINEVFSDPALVTCGVPQGSILGPLLFLLYVNDIPQSVECELLLYADDTCLIFQHKKVEVIENSLNKDFANLCDWFVDNRLSIHLGEDKTKTILFGSNFFIFFYLQSLQTRIFCHLKVRSYIREGIMRLRIYT